MSLEIISAYFTNISLPFHCLYHLLSSITVLAKGPKQLWTAFLFSINTTVRSLLDYFFPTCLTVIWLPFYCFYYPLFFLTRAEALSALFSSPHISRLEIFSPYS